MSFGGVPIDALALTASSLVILPPFPEPSISIGFIPFSSSIFLAAGDE